MRLWNGWGDEKDYSNVELSSSLKALLSGLLGSGKALPIMTLEKAISKIPESKMPHHKLISTSKEDRLRHTRGQSLSDWFSMHSGAIDCFTDGVAFPRSNDEVKELLLFASENNINVIPYGGGTSVVGHINPERHGKLNLTISMANMTRLLDLDPISLLARFQPGANGPQIENQLNEEGFTLGHFPQSWEYSTLGGWIASRSSGQQSLKYGRIENLFAGGKIVTPKGTLVIPTCPASSAGPDLRQFILGSEGRMGIITEASVRISPLPKSEYFGAVFFPCWNSGMCAVRKIVQENIDLSMMRLSNSLETTSLMFMGGKSPEVINKLNSDLLSKGIQSEKVMLTFGLTDSSERISKNMQDICTEFNGFVDDSGLMSNWKHSRFRAPYLREPLGLSGYAVDTIETAVDWKNVEKTMVSIEENIRNALNDENENVFVYSHLSHVYKQGSSIYTTYIFRIGNSYEEGMNRWKKIKELGSLAILKAGGTISHQHGVGLDHKNYLVSEKGEIGIDTINSIFACLDPSEIMNSGKLTHKSDNI